MIVVQLSLLDELDRLVEKPGPERRTAAGPAVRLLRATARSILLDCEAIGVAPALVLKGLKAETARAEYADTHRNVTVAGRRGVETWERAARDRLRAARLQLEDDAERGRVRPIGVAPGSHAGEVTAPGSHKPSGSHRVRGAAA